LPARLCGLTNADENDTPRRRSTASCIKGLQWMVGNWRKGEPLPGPVLATTARARIGLGEYRLSAPSGSRSLPPLFLFRSEQVMWLYLRPDNQGGGGGDLFSRYPNDRHSFTSITSSNEKCDAMLVNTSPVFAIALVLVGVDHVASLIVNANHCVM
jgi:hypothetical protein